MQSTTKQLYHDANNEADIPMQRLRCRAFAEQNGWTIVCELQEEGISGHKVRAENRDKVQMIKDYALKQKFDILLVFIPYWTSLIPICVPLKRLTAKSAFASFMPCRRKTHTPSLKPLQR